MSKVNPNTAPVLATFITSAFFLSATAFAALAQDEVPQSWVPEVLEMPEDSEVLSDRAVGSSLRMFSFSTATDVDALLDQWEEALDLDGYTLLAAQIETLDRVIEFSGQGINNAKIAVQPIKIDGRYVIELDATIM